MFSDDPAWTGEHPRGRRRLWSRPRALIAGGAAAVMPGTGSPGRAAARDGYRSAR